MSKSVDAWEFIPIRSLCIIYIETWNLANIVAPSTSNKKQGADKESPMLISFWRLWRSTPVRSSHPIKSVVSMFPKSPGITKRFPICSSTSKDDHHAISNTSSADTSWMIGPWGRDLWIDLNFSPLSSHQDIIDPHIWHWLAACISALYYEKRLKISHNMSISGGGCSS